MNVKVNESKQKFELKQDSGNWYDVEFFRIDNESKLLRWIIYLSSQGWVTRAHINELIRAANAQLNLNLNPYQL